MNTNRNGQLWIDKNSPYRLKYSANGTVYEMNTDVAYELGGREEFSVGTVLAFCGGEDEENKPIIAKKAVFPDDLDNIIGIAGNDITYNLRSLSLMKTGIISMTREKANTLFGGGSLTIDDVGKQIYWFIGKFDKVGSNYVFMYDRTADAGRITLSTPSGSDATDTHLNVGYDNLPIIGNIYSVDTDEVKIFINLEKLDTSIEWNWPLNPEANASWDTVTDKSIKVRHGLLTDTAQCFCRVIAIDGDGKEYNVSTNIENKKSTEEDKDQYTEVYLGSDSAIKYRILGTVNYKFGVQNG